MGRGEIENYVFMVGMGEIFQVVTHTTSTTRNLKLQKVIYTQSQKTNKVKIFTA